MIERTKQERRNRAWAYQCNAQVVAIKLGEAGLDSLKHPNRFMEKQRSSNKGRKVA